MVPKSRLNLRRFLLVLQIMQIKNHHMIVEIDVFRFSRFNAGYIEFYRSFEFKVCKTTMLIVTEKVNRQIIKFPHYSIVGSSRSVKGPCIVALLRSPTTDTL